MSNVYVPEQPCANGCHHGHGPDRTPILCDDSAIICAKCVDRLDTWLRQIPDTYALLPSVVEHGTVATNPETASTKRPDPPAPLRLEVLDLLDDRPQRGAAGLLDSWADVVRDQRHLHAPAPSTAYGVTASCSLLIQHLPWISKQEWAPEFYSEVKPLVREMRDRVGEYRPRPVGTCWVPVWRDQDGTQALVACGGLLFLDLDRRGCHCVSCGVQYDAADPALRRLGRRVGLIGDDVEAS